MSWGEEYGCHTPRRKYGQHTYSLHRFSTGRGPRVWVFEVHLGVLPSRLLRVLALMCSVVGGVVGVVCLLVREEWASLVAPVAIPFRSVENGRSTILSFLRQ